MSCAAPPLLCIDVSRDGLLTIFDERFHATCSRAQALSLPLPSYLPSSGESRDDVRCPPAILPSLRSCIDLGIELPVKLHEESGDTAVVFLG